MEKEEKNIENIEKEEKNLVKEEKDIKKEEKSIKNKIRNHPAAGSALLALILGTGGCLLWLSILTVRNGESISLKLEDDGLILLLFIGICSACFAYPLILTVINLIGIIRLPKSEKARRTQAAFAVITFLLGSVDSLLYIWFSDFAGSSSILLAAQWNEQRYIWELHQPIWTEGVPTVAVLCITGVIGYLILMLVRLEKLPPLVIVLSISGMYLGILESIVWCVQVMGEHWILCLFPINCVLLAVQMIRRVIAEWNGLEEARRKEEDRNREEKNQGGLNGIRRLLRKASLWPALAFVLMWPLLGVLLCILILFGQKPDAVIKAWTETADWRLSGRTAPPSLPYDGHYLCTVAAGGHAGIVKPIRMGERHGHRVVVNRQLCIANAFEQILEERTPRFHKAVRRFYDTCGFPIAKLIRTKAAADLVYVLMKPLEWIFLAVIYLCDAKPENRIAVQYLPKRR